MSVEGYVSFLQHMGHTVIHIGEHYWFDVYPHVYLSFPFHSPVDPTTLNLQAVFKQGGWLVRFPCPVESGKPSYRLTCKDPDYHLSTLSAKARNQTRRGLENCSVRPVKFSELTHSGLRLNRDTLLRQGRKIPANFDEYWLRYYHYAELTDGAEAWGAFVGKELAAYLIAFHMDNCANIFIIRSLHAQLKKYPNNALLFEYIKETLKNGFSKEVSIGFESIQSTSNSLDHFKLNLGFKKEPVGQRLEMAPWLRRLMHKPLLNRILSFTPNKALDRVPGNLLRTLQWYLEQPDI